MTVQVSWMVAIGLALSLSVHAQTTPEAVHKARKLRAEAAYLEMKGDTASAASLYSESLQYLDDPAIAQKVRELTSGEEVAEASPTPEIPAEEVLAPTATEDVPAEMVSAEEPPAEEPPAEGSAGVTIEPAGETHEALGVRFTLPEMWMSVEQKLENALYAGQAEGVPQMIFGFGWDADVEQKIENNPAGMDVKQLDDQELLGETYAVYEMTGGPQPVWVRQWVAKNPRSDGKKNVLVGGGGPLDTAPIQEEIVKEIIGSLRRSESLLNPATSPAEQNVLARQLFNQISDLDDDALAEAETLYLQLMEQQPDTRYAEEAYWRLGNMYRMAFDPPKNEEAITLLERYLKTYPGSRFLEDLFPMFSDEDVSLVQNRLLLLYEETGKKEELAALYDQVIPDPARAGATSAARLILYAQAMEAVGRNDDAIAAYSAVLENHAEMDEFNSSIARESLERLGAVKQEE